MKNGNLETIRIWKLGKELGITFIGGECILRKIKEIEAWALS